MKKGYGQLCKMSVVFCLTGLLGACALPPVQDMPDLPAPEEMQAQTQPEPEREWQIQEPNFPEASKEDNEELLLPQPEDMELTGEEEDGESEPEEAADPDVYLTISAAGDCSLGNYHSQIFTYSFVETYEQQQNPAYFLENVQDYFAQDDLTVVNLEGVLTLSENLTPGRAYNIKGDPEYAKILSAGSVEAVSMANNHRLDYGESGTEDTVRALQEENIQYAYDSNVTVCEAKGLRVGIVSVNAVGGGGMEEKLAQQGIDSLKEEGVDLILACCHWGIEKEHYPNDRQKNLAHKCVDWGADLVIGHHPHVLQGIEEYQGRYILYSLGNFSFGANRNPVDKDTMIFQQTFHFHEGEKQEDSTAYVIPCSVSSVRERNDYRPTPASGSEWERIIERLSAFSQGMGVEISEDGRVNPKEN